MLAESVHSFADTGNQALLFLGAPVRLRPSLTFDEFNAAINVTEANVRNAVPAARMIYIEPDVKRELGNDPPPA